MQTFKWNDIFGDAAVYICRTVFRNVFFKTKVSVKTSLSVSYTVDESLFISQAVILVSSGSKS